MSAATPVARLSRRWQIAASHRLHVDGFDAERNLSVYGKCNNPHGHGHNYTIEVTLAGPVDPVTGMVTNLSDLDRFALTEVIERFDHQNLNTLAEFREARVVSQRPCPGAYRWMHWMRYVHRST